MLKCEFSFPQACAPLFRLAELVEDLEEFSDESLDQLAGVFGLSPCHLDQHPSPFFCTCARVMDPGLEPPSALSCDLFELLMTLVLLSRGELEQKTRYIFSLLLPAGEGAPLLNADSVILALMQVVKGVFRVTAVRCPTYRELVELVNAPKLHSFSSEELVRLITGSPAVLAYLDKVMPQPPSKPDPPVRAPAGGWWREKIGLPLSGRRGSAAVVAKVEEAKLG